jgi:hypothetical protein
MHWRLLTALISSGRTSEFYRIALVNDSCRILRSLQPMFTWAALDNNARRNVWGISKSYEVAEHLQSFFLVFDGTAAILSMFQFVSDNNVFEYSSRSKAELVAAFEVGISQHMIREGFELHAPYTTYSLRNIESFRPMEGFDNQLNYGPNPAYYLWDRMCPLVKKARLHFAEDETVVSQHTSPEFSNDAAAVS